MAKQRTHFDKIPVEMREHMAENMKERIYATITLVAVITALWQTAEHHTVVGVISAILGTIFALWAATLISARVSYRAVYNKAMNRRELTRLLFTSSGLFAPALAPIFFVLLSSTHLFSMQNALLAGMITLLLSLFAFSFSASRRIYPNLPRAVVISLLEMLVGVGVIALKLVAGE